MIDLSYSEFKSKLISNPRWIARAIMVLCYNPHVLGTHPDSTDELVLFAKAIQSNGGLHLPFTLESRDGKDTIRMVRRYASQLYNYYRQKQKVKRELEAQQ